MNSFLAGCVSGAAIAMFLAISLPSSITSVPPPNAVSAPASYVPSQIPPRATQRAPQPINDFSDDDLICHRAKRTVPWLCVGKVK